MVQLGEQLLTPEKGWKRIHINDILKSDSNKLSEVGFLSMNDTRNGIKTFSCIFTGTKLRIISTLNTVKYSFNSSLFIFKNNSLIQSEEKEQEILTWVGSVFIDCEFAGRIYTDFGNKNKNGQTLTLLFEKCDIPDGDHLLNISIFTLNNYRSDQKISAVDFDLDYFDIDQNGKMECLLYNEDYSRDQISKFINLNYKELVESFPNKYISCKILYDGMYDKSDWSKKRFGYYFSNFELIDKIPKIHPPRTSIYGTIYDLDDIFEIYNDSNNIVKRLIKISYDSIMIKNRFEYLLTENIDWDHNFYKFQNKVEDKKIGKGEAEVILYNAILKTKFLIDLKNQGYFSGLCYWWGSSEYNLKYIIRILYSKDNIIWYTFNTQKRIWEVCPLDQINERGIIQFGDPYGSPVSNISSKEYKSFFDGISQIGCAIGITPNQKNNINFFDYPNDNISFITFLQNISSEEISLSQYCSVYPNKPICDTLYFIPINDPKKGKIEFLNSHNFSYLPNRYLYELFDTSGYNGIPLIRWKYYDLLNYQISDLCHVMFSYPNHKNKNIFDDSEYSEYLKFIKNHSIFKQSYIFSEGLFIDELFSLTNNNLNDPSYDYNIKATHFNGWAEQIHLDGCRYLSYYDYIPRLKLTFEPILNQSNIIKTNWRCIVCEHGI